MIKAKSANSVFVFCIFIITLIVGNLLIYGVDEICVSMGQKAMTLHDYFVLNFVITGMSILVPFLIYNKKFNAFINKIFS